MHKADYFEEHKDNLVKCTLCPHNCVIKQDGFGLCRVRKNVKGTLYSEVYGKVSGYRFDPIEKKPLYHFYPGGVILSLGTHGCNLRCQFCQNCEISQPKLNDYANYKTIFNDKIINDSTSNTNNIGLAFTYNEPTVWFEFMRDLAIENKKNGFQNVMVSNGFINPEPLKELLDYIDAFNIDLKAFSENFYKKITKSALNPVLNTLETIKKANIHLEITNLIIPEENDNPLSFKEMIDWISGTLGENTVLHLSRYFPNYNFSNPSTSPEKMLEFYEIASESLNYVYLGNINLEAGNDTYCPSCKAKVIRRLGYSTQITGIDQKGNCSRCNYPIEVVM